MATKKANVKSPRAREASPKYKAAPRKESPGEALWLMFQALSDEEQGAFLQRLVEDDELSEDVYDMIVLTWHKDEPSRPFEEFVAELERERKL